MKPSYTATNNKVFKLLMVVKRYRFLRRYMKCFCSIISLIIMLHMIANNAKPVYFESKSNYMVEEWDQLSQKEYIIDTPGCRIPSLEPTTSLTHKMLTKKLKLNCSVFGGTFIMVVNYNIPTLDCNALRKSYPGVNPNDVKCLYSEIIRKDDYSVTFGPEKNLVLGAPHEVEFSVVKCSVIYKKLIRKFENFLAIPVFKPEVEQKFVTTDNEFQNNKERLNVIIFGIDSVSRLASIRHLVKTRKFLFKKSSHFKTFEFKGFMKVGVNSFPNQGAAIMLGRPNSQVESERLTSEGELIDYGELIFTKYEFKGYRTYYVEEAPEYPLFSLWSKPPTHYYGKTFTNTFRSKYKLATQLNLGFCTVGGRSSAEEILSYFNRFCGFMTSHKKPFFAYNWLNDAPHEDINGPSAYDDFVLQSLENLNHDGVLNRTFLFVMSDHGFRYGRMRINLRGRLEESLPFVAAHVPTWWLKLNSKIAESLDINQYRFATFFDVHATLLQLAGYDLNNYMLPNKYSSSLFNPLSRRRNCDTGGVEIHQCVCIDTQIPHDVSSWISVCLADRAVDNMNRYLRLDLCHKHELFKILDLRELRYTNTPIERGVSHFWIALETKVANRLLQSEISLSHNFNDNTTQIQHSAMLSRYADFDTSCWWKVEVFKHFCVCKR